MTRYRRFSPRRGFFGWSSENPAATAGVLCAPTQPHLNGPAGSGSWARAGRSAGGVGPVSIDAAGLLGESGALGDGVEAVEQTEASVDGVGHDTVGPADARQGQGRAVDTRRSRR